MSSNDGLCSSVKQQLSPRLVQILRFGLGFACCQGYHPRRCWHEDRLALKLCCGLLLLHSFSFLALFLVFFKPSVNPPSSFLYSVSFRSSALMQRSVSRCFFSAWWIAAGLMRVCNPLLMLMLLTVSSLSLLFSILLFLVLLLSLHHPAFPPLSGAACLLCRIAPCCVTVSVSDDGFDCFRSPKVENRQCDASI